MCVCVGVCGCVCERERCVLCVCVCVCVYVGDHSYNVSILQNVCIRNGEENKRYVKKQINNRFHKSVQ